MLGRREQLVGRLHYVPSLGWITSFILQLLNIAFLSGHSCIVKEKAHTYSSRFTNIFYELWLKRSEEGMERRRETTREQGLAKSEPAARY